MKNLFMTLSVALLSVSMAACAGDDGAAGPQGPAGANGADGSNGQDGADGTDGAAGSDGAAGMDGSDGANAGDFAFRTDAPSAYTPVDRMGMPAINSAVIGETMKDAYNVATPADDANGDFVAEITANVDGLHTALDDDLAGLSLAPCATADCVNQAAPLVVPDTLKIDRTAAPGFPNGRLLADPVIDVTLAVVLLDLADSTGCGGGACSVLTLANVPVNPPANDVDFLQFFPYVAPPF